MAKLFVANCTRQEQRVFYRLDFNAEGVRTNDLKANFKFTDIPRGQQRPVGGDLHRAQIDEIVGQLRVYGAMDVSEIGRQQGVITYLISVDRAITAKEIETVHAYNQGLQIDEGRKRREAAAIAASQLVQNATDEQPSSFAVEMEQLDISEADEKGIGEGYQVVADAPERTKRNYTRRQPAH